MRRASTITVVSLLFLLSSGAGWADSRDDARVAARQRAHRNLKAATVEFGHAFRALGRATGREAARIGRGLDEATRKPRRDAANAGESLWTQASDEAAEVLRDVAAALRNVFPDARGTGALSE